MAVKHLWDTNTVIYYLQQHFPPKAEKFIDNLLSISQPAISVMTEIELLCWKTTSRKDLITLQGFIDDCKVIELEKPIKLQTAEIRKEHTIKLPDAIIAATALTFNLDLITRNVKDFCNIKRLSVVNPFEVE